MITIITILIVIACLAIIGIVLIQNPKGGGISSSFGALNQIGGVKQTTEGVEKVTWMMAISLVVLCLAATPYMKGGQEKGDGTGGKLESTVPMNTPSGAPMMQTPPNK